MFHTFSYRAGFIHLSYFPDPEYRAQHGNLMRHFSSLKAAKRWLSMQARQPQAPIETLEHSHVHH
jgi:hypothetical protein